jgi:hypothetical protein
MTLSEALAIAAQAKPLRRASFDKLHRSFAAAQFMADVIALSKRYDVLGGTVADMQKRLNQIAADIDHLENTPGQKRRTLN